MNKYIRSLMFLFIIAISLLGTISPVFADKDINIVGDDVDIHFPGALVFKIQANSDTAITEIRLNYTVKRMDFAYVISEAWPNFVPSTNVDTQWIWDMRYSVLPPGAEVKYWWLLKNQNGDSIKTDVKTVIFEDTTHTWKKITSKNINILWYEGDNDFAAELMAAAIDSLDRLYEDTGARLEDPIQVFIYADSTGLQQSMISPREWTGGVARTEYGVIAIGISPNDLEWGENAMAHELGHLAVHQITFSPYGVNLPTWLDEGLAMHAEFSQDSYSGMVLQSALNSNSLISLRSLCSPFSALGEAAYLSYAESNSVVEYLIEEYGRDKILSLLLTFKEGSTYDDALQEVYGFNMEELESRWINSLKTTYK
jgi:hypothetical protein